MAIKAIKWTFEILGLGLGYQAYCKAYKYTIPVSMAAFVR